MSLIEFWENSREATMSKTIQQIVAMAGDGDIKDNSPCAVELRSFFQRVARKYLQTYAQSCLDTSFPNSGFVLQDIVNEVGRRLGFDVTHGVYRGQKNFNNYDGFWTIDGWSFIVEVKTTDTYSISLDKIAEYLAAAESDGDGGCISVLIVVGRNDTATLEDQLRGSRHNWDMRIIGVDALFKALELRESSENPDLSSRLVEILKPQEFTRVDQILPMAFDFATDREDALEAVPINEDVEVEGGGEPVDTENSSARVVVSDRNSIEALKVLIAEKLAQEFGVTLTRNQSSFENRAGGYRFSVATSKYDEEKKQYRFNYYPRQSDFLNAVDHGYFVLGHLDTGKAFAIPIKKMDEMAQHMYLVKPKDEESRRFHPVNTKSDKGRDILITRNGSPDFDITEYQI